ncbi:hypothetical protein PHJA_002380800 [Phtheirospermum japonicum]|uniref:Uncharacterized protein n=1 Tax=Phtheirospermum japonicum TaxID=374723 RepID=A0A830CP66_9LAMI|nr:hypothetical protein PHJA_002380800 [Phtheirospermum japonicum]
MSITKFVIINGFLPSLNFEPSHKSKSRISVYSSSNIVTSYNQDRSFLWNDNSRRVKKGDKNRRRFLVRSVVPGAPPPSEPPFNFINWIVGVSITVVLPFITHKWASLLKLKNEVETAVETVEDIVEAVEKVAEGVEKAAEDIADDLPEGGALRKAVDFVEHVAERANRDAQLVGDFIDKVQEVEEKVEGYVESWGEHANASSHEQYNKEEDEEKDGALELLKEENINPFLYSRRSRRPSSVSLVRRLLLTIKCDCATARQNHWNHSPSRALHIFLIGSCNLSIPAAFSRIRTLTAVYSSRNFSVYNSVQQDPPMPSKPPSSSLKWILGTVLATILPFAGNRWGPLLKFKEDVDTVVETVEDIIEVVEKVAEVVDKVAENVSSGLPEGGKLKKVVDVVEDVAEKTAKDAQIVGDVIDKFQEVEEKVENIVDTLSDKANEHTIEAKG